MAETKLTMSLDDLIAQASKKRERKPKESRQSGGPAPQSGPRKGLSRNRQKNAANGNTAPQQQQQRPKQQQQPQQQAQPQQQQSQRQAQQQGGQRNRKSGGSNLGVRGGQVQKRNVIEVPARMIRAPLQAPAPLPRRQPQSQRQPAPDGKWEHDLYSDDYQPPRRAPVSQVAASSTKLIITNLHHQVSEDDLLELFSTCGSVKSCKINFDNSGRSLGTGTVVFETRAEAEAAKNEYNGVKLDQRPMNIAFADGAASGTLTKLSSGILVQKPGAAGGGASGGGGGNRASGAGGAAKAGSGGQRLAAAAIRETAAASRGGRGGRSNRLRSAVVGRAQLDADLKDYMQE